MFKHYLYGSIVIAATGYYCVSDTAGQRREIRKFNATHEICDRLIPPRASMVAYGKRHFDYMVLAQLVLKRSVNFSFLGTLEKRLKGVLAQVRIHDEPAGRFEGYEHDYYIDCPPGIMNTIYIEYPLGELAPGIRATWHAPVHAGRPIFVHTIFMDYRGVLWYERNRLDNIIAPLGASILSPERSVETNEFILKRKLSSHEAFIRDLADKVKGLKMSERYPQRSEEVRRKEEREHEIDSLHNSSFDDVKLLYNVYDLEI